MALYHREDIINDTLEMWGKFSPTQLLTGAVAPITGCDPNEDERSMILDDCYTIAFMLGKQFGKEVGTSRKGGELLDARNELDRIIALAYDRRRDINKRLDELEGGGYEQLPESIAYYHGVPINKV